MTIRPDPPEGWERKYIKAGAPEQWRCQLGNGRMLVIVQFSPRKWYYGEAVDKRRKGWTSRGHETSRDKAMAAAVAYVQNTYEQR